MSDAADVDRLLAALAQRLAPETPYDRTLRYGRARMASRHAYNLMLSWYRKHPVGTAVVADGERDRLFVASVPFETGAPDYRWMVRLSSSLKTDPKGDGQVDYVDRLRKVVA